MSPEAELHDSLHSTAAKLDLPTGDLQQVTRRGRRRRKARRLVGAAGGAAVVLVLTVIGSGLLDARAPVDIIDQPTPPPSELVPAGWREVQLGTARFGVPAGWEVAELQPGDGVCRNMADHPTVYLAPYGLTGDGICPARGHGASTLVAMPLSTITAGSPRVVADEPVVVNGHTGRRDDATAEFPGLDLYLSYHQLDQDPPGFDAVLATVHGDEPEPTEPPQLEVVPCPPNADCLGGTSFLLDGSRYHTDGTCGAVRDSSVGPALDVRAEPPSADVPALHRLAGYPLTDAVVVDGRCDQPVLATPADEITDQQAALVRARMRCDVLVEPAPGDRCEVGGDAQWRAGDAWYDDAYAPFPWVVRSVDAMLASGNDELQWRTDPLQVAERRYRDESVCHDGDQACPLELTVTDRTTTSARLTGTVHPFPNVVWDITITVERLGENSWWTTRMTIEPRDGS